MSQISELALSLDSTDALPETAAELMYVNRHSEQPEKEDMPTSTTPAPNPATPVRDTNRADAIWTPQYRLKIISALLFPVTDGALPGEIEDFARAAYAVATWTGAELEGERDIINRNYYLATNQELPETMAALTHDEELKEFHEGRR